MKAGFLLCLLLSCISLHLGACGPPKVDCTAVLCMYCPLRVQLKIPKNECCHPCLPYCPCEGDFQKACTEQGFKDLILLPGQHVYTHHGTQKCKCHDNGQITCRPICPKLPPKCKYIGTNKDGCAVCT